MKPPTYDQAALLPLLTEQEIVERVDQLIGRANQRQLWLLFLDEFGVQLPLLIPIDGLPAHPSDRDVAGLLVSVRAVMTELDARCLIVVLERYADAALTAQDVEWASALRRGCELDSLVLRALLLSHRRGVRLIANDEL